jgi:hypothetical protein
VFVFKRFCSCFLGLHRHHTQSGEECVFEREPHGRSDSRGDGSAFRPHGFPVFPDDVLVAGSLPGGPSTARRTAMSVSRLIGTARWRTGASAVRHRAFPVGRQATGSPLNLPGSPVKCRTRRKPCWHDTETTPRLPTDAVLRRENVAGCRPYGDAIIRVDAGPPPRLADCPSVRGDGGSVARLVGEAVSKRVVETATRRCRAPAGSREDATF